MAGGSTNDTRGVATSYMPAYMPGYLPVFAATSRPTR